ncbi:MAG TPA: nucleotide exchange factor GrpE [Pyrinomonadaceae bacterium]|nr:nucleotide exchange factor GrpE [Pyrinomonadaceae bacterium]
MADKGNRKANRIPVRFADGEEQETSNDASPEATGEGGLSPEEIGRESAYEDATEVERRIRRGDEQDTEAGRERADEEDVAGGPDPSELPRSRQDQGTTAPHTEGEEESEDAPAAAAASSDEAQFKASASSGPALAELLATRAELRRIETELKKLSEEKKDWKDKSARLQADFDNFRKRTERERSDTYSRALGEVVSRLLPVLDNLQRALEAERLVEAKETKEFRHFLHGVELINRQLGGVLESLGVEIVPTVGELFDPHIHEAVATEAKDGADPDTIIQEMQRGYRLGDKLLRPAMVKVATKA